jgi:hypothetical protein
MMLAMITQSVVPFSDLRFAAIRCSICKAELIVDLLYEKYRDGDPERLAPVVPEHCPICNVWFDTTAIGGLELLRRAYKHLSAQKTVTVEFHVAHNDVSSKQ